MQQVVTYMNTMIRLFKEEAGATAIEYGLIAALISIAAIAAMTILGTQLSATFTTISDALAR